MSWLCRKSRPIIGPRKFELITFGADELPTNVAIMRDRMPDGSVIEATVVFTSYGAVIETKYGQRIEIKK